MAAVPPTVPTKKMHNQAMRLDFPVCRTSRRHELHHPARPGALGP